MVRENEEYFIIAKTCSAEEIHRLTRCQINTSNWLAAGVLHIAFVLRYPPLSSCGPHSLRMHLRECGMEFDTIDPRDESQQCR